MVITGDIKLYVFFFFLSAQTSACKPFSYDSCMESLQQEGLNGVAEKAN